MRLIPYFVHDDIIESFFVIWLLLCRRSAVFTLERGMDMEDLLVRIDDVLYSWLLIYLLTLSGIYFSIRTRCVQIRRFRDALACMMEKKDGDKGVHPSRR